MKIVCDSCGAKYSIADEKVAGKVFKIRCKKCSAVIVVKGDSQEEGDEATRVYDYGSEAVWHVVVGGDQQGPLAPKQIADLLAEGKIDWEAYVWREGMDGWQPAKDVEPLVSAITSESSGTPGPESAGSAQQGQIFGGSSDMGADPFAGNDDGGLSGVMGQPTASAAAAGGGADLFAQSSRSPFAGSDEGRSVPNGKGHSSPRVAESEAMTGQRNENSVLFSLSNLQALATGSSSAPASNRPKAGMAQGEGSGLIDIRALASATQAVAERPANGSTRDKVEDLLAVGSGPAFSAATLAAPVAQEKGDGGKMMMGLMGGAILLLGAAVGYLALRPQAAPVAQAGQPAGIVAEAPAGAPGTAPAAQAAGTVPNAPAAAPVPTEAEAEKPAAKAAESDSSDDKADRSDRKSSRRGSDAPAAAKADKPAAEPKAEKAPEAAPAPAKQSSGDKSIDDLLDGALNGKPKPAAKPAASASDDLPSTPSRDDVLGAMKAVTPRVQACGNGQSGIANAKIGVAGPTGRVTSVEVSGQFAGTPVAACIVKEVSKAKFPKFSQSTFSFSYPFKI